MSEERDSLEAPPHVAQPPKPSQPPQRVVEYANPELHLPPPSTPGQRGVGWLGVLVYGVLAAPFVLGVIINAYMGRRSSPVLVCSIFATLFLWRAVAAARQAWR